MRDVSGYNMPVYGQIDSPFWIDLQWFAAEDEGRTEEPTEYKIRKAREEGKVAKSTEFTSSLVLLFPIIGMGILASYFFTNMLDMLTFFLNMSTEMDITRESRVFSIFMRYFIKITLPILAIAFLAAVIGNVFQVGFLFTVKPVVPDLKRIVPRFGKFFKRAFFSGEAFFNLTKSVLKIVVIGIIAYINIRNELETISHFVHTSFWFSLSALATIGFRIMVEAAVAMLVLSIFDYIFQRRQYRESLKMTRQELKEERKMHEGDPLIQSRLRERMRELLSQNMLRNVPRADVVITNPTHYAVAMEWKRETMVAPMVIAKGADHVAHRMKEIAEEHNIPIIENKPLARVLHSEVDIGDIIPEKYWEAMAIVLAEVYRMTGRTAEAI